MRISVVVQYHALLRERMGRGEERVETDAVHPAGLFDQLAAEHRLPWPRAAFRPAVNDAFCAWDQPLAAGDRVSFIPPVAGG